MRLQVVLNSDALEFGGLCRIDEKVGWARAVACDLACSSRVAGGALHQPGAIQQQVTRVMCASTRCDYETVNCSPQIQLHDGVRPLSHVHGKLSWYSPCCWRLILTSIV